MATKINNVSQDSLANIARKLGGKLWQKNGHIRIYVGGGNNYHYDGGWYYDIGDKGYWEARCYLTRGYGNKNREAYVNKYIGRMEDDMEEAIAEVGNESAGEAAPAPAAESTPAESAMEAATAPMDGKTFNV